MSSPYCVYSYFLLLSFFVITVPIEGRATPLPDNTLLTIEPGVLSGSTGQDGCASGSCVGYEEFPGVYIWYAINPGTDGGIVIGKDQVCGDQFLNASSSQSGEMTAASVLFFFGPPQSTFCTAPMTAPFSGTVVTTDASANIFSDTSCSGAACLGNTHIGTWHVAYNQAVIPMGSSGGCLAPACTADQLSGIDVSSWTITSNPSGPAGYDLEYSWVIPDGDPSGFGGIPLVLRLAGDIVMPGAPQLDGAWKSSIVDVLFIFGENLNNITELLVNGVDLTSSTNPAGADNRLLLVLAPGITPPFTVNMTTTEGVAQYPQNCP